MYLAVILGFCALTSPATATAVRPGAFVGIGVAINPEFDRSPDHPQTDSSPSGSTQGSSQDTSAQPGSAAPDSQKPASEKTGSEKPSAPTAQTEATKPKTTTKKRRRRKPATTATASTPGKKVVRNGGTTDPAVQLAPGVSDEQASRERQSTSQLLSTTDTNLKQISARQLSASQQESVSQIRKYMEQAKEAEASGDVQRAQNLASKALMLSDDLVKH
jgi:hypothetical protein